MGLAVGLQRPFRTRKSGVLSSGVSYKPDRRPEAPRIPCARNVFPGTRAMLHAPGHPPPVGTDSRPTGGAFRRSGICPDWVCVATQRPLEFHTSPTADSRRIPPGETRTHMLKHELRPRLVQPTVGVRTLVCHPGNVAARKTTESHTSPPAGRAFP